VSSVAWAFTEEQRDEVCKGKLCPACLSPHSIKEVGGNPDGLNLNLAFDCLACGAQWEGY
jgi:hypothetical protein